MQGATMEQATRQLLAVLREGFEGPAGDGSYFVDNNPDAGAIGTLAAMSAAEASMPVGGSTIAAHASHMVFALEASSAWIRGDRSPRKWRESWSRQAVDDAGWQALKADFNAGYEDLLGSIDSHGRDDEMSIGGAIGALAHAAYHLGAIRQKLLCLRQGQGRPPV
jgi:hypothetical protein